MSTNGQTWKYACILQCYHEGEAFLQRIGTGNEMWVYDYEPASKNVLHGCRFANDEVIWDVMHTCIHTQKHSSQMLPGRS